MVKVNWTTQAIEDTYQISEYHRQYSEKYAEQIIEKVFEKTNSLEQYPMLGRAVPELKNPNIRELIHKNYRIIYIIVSDDRIDVITIHNSLRPLNEESIID